MGERAPVKLLLDTHIWLWSLLEPGRLAARVAEALEDPDNELWLSPISVWEALMLAERRRIVLEPDASTWVRTWLASAPMREAPLNHEVAIESQAGEWHMSDPADRFLAATARVFDLTLVTADRRLARSKRIRILRN
jgi:PIN domain nuclease of toxin-antitoxin system